MVKILAIAGALAAMTATASAQYRGYQGYQGYRGYGTGSNPSSVYHQGYTTRSGTYVAPHYQSAPDSTQLDNWGTRGNTNPFTGRRGTRSPRW